jgi:hypothetical protein
MVEEIRSPEAPPENPSVRYERTDASFRWVLGLIIAAAVLGAIIFVALWWFYGEENRRLDARRRSNYPLAPTPTTNPRTVPEPRLEQLDRLQGIETSNVYVREKVKEDRLGQYGPTEEKGFLHIPIDRAMELLATTKRLPARSEKAVGTPRDNGLVDGGGPNSGRLFNGRLPRWSAP